MDVRRRVFSEIKAAFASRKKRWLFAFASAQLVPILEAAFISTIYIILDLDQRKALAGKMSVLGFGAVEAGGEGFLTAVFAVGLVLLFLCLALRYAGEMNLLRLQVDLYALSSSRLVDRYLYTSVSKARAISKELITDSLINGCPRYAFSVRQGFVLFGAVFSMLVYIIGAAVLSWKILVMTLVIYSVPLWLNRRRFEQMETVGDLKVRSQEEMLKFFQEAQSGFGRARVDGLERELKRRSEDVLANSFRWRFQKGGAMAKHRIYMDGMSLFGVFVIIYFAASVLAVPLATLMILFVVFNRLKSYMTILSQSLLSLRESLPQVYRYIELLEELDSHVTDAKTIAGDEKASLSKVELKNVSFRYEDSPALADVSLTAEAGDRVLVQGPSGHGKSTLLQVMLGILPPSSGGVYYDGEPMSDRLFYRIRNLIAYASPDVYVFDGSLRDNLLMGARRNGDDRLDEAVRLSGLDRVVKELPEGLDTNIGENGNALSLGQRQRLILARIYLKKPKLVLLDEATANLDPELEEEVIRNLLSFIDDDAILIMVAHKAPGGVGFSKRFWMENGRLSAAGEGSLVNSKTDE